MEHPRFSQVQRSRGLELVARLVFMSAFSSVGIFTLAASVYPGGNHFDHQAVGHDFWKNALCDVARSTAVGGAPNAIGASLARTAMSIMAVGIGALFWLMPERFPSRVRLGAFVRWLGALTVPAAVAVVLLPSDRFGFLHGVAIVIAGLPGLSAGLVATVGLVRARRGSRVVPILAITTLLVASACFGIYVDELVTGGPPRLAVPVLERIAALLLIGWMISASALPPGQPRSPASIR
jgi:hypothetical protein